MTVQVEHRTPEAETDAFQEKLQRSLKVATGLAMELELLAPGELSRLLNVEDRVKATRVWDRRG